MAIATSSAGTSAFAKFTELGDKVIGALGSDPFLSKRQQRDFDTQRPKFKDDGRPAMEEILHLIAMPGTTARTGNADSGYEPIEDGDHIRYALAGFKWGRVIDARKGLPARGGFRAGQSCSGDVYTIELVGWSAETKNAKAAEAAGFTVRDGRVILRSQEEKDRYVLAQSKAGGNTNPAKDIEITIRRPTDAEKAWEQAADRLFESKPWVFQANDETSGQAPGNAHAPDFDEEPF
jgi:hypothetical protein